MTMKTLSQLPTNTLLRWQRLQVLIATAWVGSIWTIGYLVAPTLFATLPDRMLAGSVAAQLFFVEAWFSVVCAIVQLLLLIVLLRSSTALCLQTGWLATVRASLAVGGYIILGMLTCTVLGYFVLHPFMSALRATGLVLPDAKWKFGLLHTVSSGFYLVQSVLGVVLMLRVASDYKV